MNNLFHRLIPEVSVHPARHDPENTLRGVGAGTGCENRLVIEMNKLIFIQRHICTPGIMSKSKAMSCSNAGRFCFAHYAGLVRTGSVIGSLAQARRSTIPKLTEAGSALVPEKMKCDVGQTAQIRFSGAGVKGMQSHCSGTG